jgi:hypothetical protein
MAKKQKQQKRSPDLSGQRVAVNAYYRARRGIDNSPFDRSPTTKNIRRIFIRSLDILVIAILLVGLVYIMLVSNHPKVIVNDLTYHSTQDYQSFLTKHFGGLSNSNKITFDQGGLIALLRTSYPEIRNASVELPVFSRQPVFRLEVATPALFLNSQGNSYLINTNGVAVGFKNKYKNLTSLPEIVDQSGFDVKTGKQVLSSHDVEFILAVAKEMKVYNIPVKSLTIPNLAQQLNIYTADAPYYTKFFTGGDPAIQTAQMIAARHQFATAGGPSQYLDVRVSGKVFYK